MRHRVTAGVMGSLLLGLGLFAFSHPIFAAEECCTPEATAKIAARAGFVDVVGIKLGMPVKEAMAAIKKHNQRLQVSMPNPLRVKSLPNVSFVGTVSA